MNLDRELLRQYYLKNGYADAQVTAANAELDRDGSGFFVTFTIDEGEPYNVRRRQHREQRPAGRSRRNAAAAC